MSQAACRAGKFILTWRNSKYRGPAESKLGVFEYQEEGQCGQRTGGRRGVMGGAREVGGPGLCGALRD